MIWKIIFFKLTIVKNANQFFIITYIHISTKIRTEKKSMKDSSKKM